MISEKVKNAAEKVMPAEKRFLDKIRGFFEKKSHRLIVSAIVGIVLLYPIYGLTCSVYIDKFPYKLLTAFLGLIELTAAGAFFSNINEFSLKKFATAVSVWSVVLYLATETLAFVLAMDINRMHTIIAIYIGNILLGIPICATAIGLTVLLAYFTVCRKK